MNKNIKAIFVDIDETLLYHHNGNHDFDKVSFRALKKAQKNGCKVIISTARPYHSAKDTGVFNLLKPDAVISANGTVATVGNEILYSDAFPQDVVNNLLSVCNNMGLVVEVATPFGRYFTDKPNEYVEEYFKVYYETVPEVRADFNGEDVNALLIFSPAECDEEMFSKLDKRITGFRFTKCGIDMHVHPVCKADGMKVVQKYFGISIDESMSIGDSFGDVPMFKLSKFSVAMGNAIDEVKEKASFTTKHIAKHGVKYALKYFEII